MVNKNNRGFSLVELLISITIMAIILIAIASFTSTTTNTYVQTKADAELQADGAETMDMLSDRIMQAKRIRIGTINGTDRKEYCSYGDHLSDGEESTGYLLKGTDYVTGSYGSSEKALTFRKLDQAAINPSTGTKLEYIAVLYETNSTDDKSYRYMLDVFYFHETELLLFRYDGDERLSAKVPSGGVAVIDPSDSTLDSFMDDNIKAVISITNMNDYTSTNLVCDSIEQVDLYAIPADNSIYITLDLKKKNKRATNSVESMITIRNGYVLQPKKYSIPV